MDAPLADAAGNALEVLYAAQYLTGRRRERRFHDVTVALAAQMLMLGGLADGERDGRERAEDVLSSGAAAERFVRMVAALGGPPDLLDHPDRHLPSAPVTRACHPDPIGRVVGIDTRALGLAVVALGGGRTRAEDRIDPAVGLTALAGIGDEVGPERPLAIVHARRESDAEAACRTIRAAYQVGDAVPPASAPIRSRIGAA